VSASKRPSTSSLRRFITSRPFVTVAELRRRFGLDEPDAMVLLRRNGTSAWIGLPEREASKLQDLWDRNELGIELSVEVRAPVVVGVYPMRIARYVMDGNGYGNGASGGNGHVNGVSSNGYSTNDGIPPIANGEERPVQAEPRERVGRPDQFGHQRRHAPRPMPGAPTYGSDPSMQTHRDPGGR
jgi:hypothetical protein